MLTQWVIKISKLCNLRCDYCYEMPELGNPARMSRDQIVAMFENMAHFYAAAPGAKVHCVWHGGEPLLQKPEYFRMIFAEQKRLLADVGVEVQNFVQTNLTILDDERIELLRAFDGFGVSLDLFGSHRLNVAGHDSQARVLRNLDRLRSQGLRFGCITVLTRRNLPHLEKIFRFYEKLDLSFRVLPLFRGASGDQNDDYQVTGEEVLTALCRLFDLWLASPTQIPVAPISELLTQIVKRRAGSEPSYYDRRSWEEVVVVNTNGDLYADGDSYQPGKSWGNIFATPLTNLFLGPEWGRSVAQAEARMAAVCPRCEFFGACTGNPIAEDARAYADGFDEAGNVRCVVERGLCAHIERRLDEATAAGVLDQEFWQRLVPTPHALSVA